MKRTDARVQNVTESERFRVTFTDSQPFMTLVYQQ